MRRFCSARVGLVLATSACWCMAAAPAGAESGLSMQQAVARVASARGGTSAIRSALQLRGQVGAGAMAEQAVQQYFGGAGEATGGESLACLAAAVDPHRTLELAAGRIDGSGSPGDRSACRLAALALAGTLRASDDGDLSGADLPVAPVESSGCGRVAYWKAADQRWELYVAGPRLAGPRLVYRSAQSPVDGTPGRLFAWSPDGSLLIFAAAAAAQRGSRLFSVRQDGSGVRCISPLSRIEFDPCWSPDGRSLAFMQADPSLPTLRSVWTMRADGSGRQRLVEDAAVPAGAPAVPVLRWTEDGSRVQWRAQPLFLNLAGER